MNYLPLIIVASFIVIFVVTGIAQSRASSRPYDLPKPDPQPGPVVETADSEDVGITLNKGMTGNLGKYDPTPRR